MQTSVSREAAEMSRYEYDSQIFTVSFVYVVLATRIWRVYLHSLKQSWMLENGPLDDHFSSTDRWFCDSHDYLSVYSIHVHSF